MLSGLLPDPNPWLVIAGVIAWDVATIAAIWLLSRRPHRRHRFKGPKLPKSRRIGNFGRKPDERVYNDLW